MTLIVIINIFSLHFCITIICLQELTLDEWRALRGSKQKPQFNIRKAGEGEDPSQWKKMYELSKKGEGDDDDEDDEYELAEYPQRVGRQKHVLDIDIHFSDARRGGRGSRGGGRGGRGRGGPGGERGGGTGGGPRPAPPAEGHQERPGPPRGGGERGGGGGGSSSGGGGTPFKPPGRGNFRQHQSAPKVCTSFQLLSMPLYLHYFFNCWAINRLSSSF